MLRSLPAFAAAAAALAQAPALPSRGVPAEAHPAPGPEVFRPAIGLLGGYDNAPLAEERDRGGGPFQELEGSLEARRSRNRVDAQMNYRLDLRHYDRSSRLDRSSHIFHLDARFTLSRRWTAIVRDAVTSSTFGSSVERPPDGFGTGFALDAGPDLFHSRTFTNTALGDLVFAASARTSVSAGADGFVVRRQSQALVDAIGWRARADVAHRYSRRKTLSLAYSFTHFDHSRSFGDADYAVWALGHSLRVGRRSELDLLAGAGWLRSAGTRAVELDPEIARLLGTARGAEIFRLNMWEPHLMAAWVQDLGRSEWRAEFARFVSDGGGVTGLARQNQADLSFRSSRIGPLVSGWRFAARLTVCTYRSLDTILYDNTAALAGGSLVRRLSPRLDAVVRYQYSFYNLQRGLLHHFRRHQVAAGVVYTFAPAGESPLRGRPLL